MLFFSTINRPVKIHGQKKFWAIPKSHMSRKNKYFLQMKTLVLILTIATLSATTLNAQIAKRGSIGIGIGVPYGIIGFNGEFAVHPYFSLSGGLGSTILAGLGYAAGARAYFKPAESKWRPRISLHYGVNSLITDIGASGITSYDDKKFSGITLGIGTKAMFGHRRKSGFDFEIVYIATTGGLQDELDRLNATGQFLHIDTPSKVRLVVGYRFGF
jgi:hypothetical protein